MSKLYNRDDLRELLLELGTEPNPKSSSYILTKQINKALKDAGKEPIDFAESLAAEKEAKANAKSAPKSKPKASKPVVDTKAKDKEDKAAKKAAKKAKKKAKKQAEKQAEEPITETKAVAPNVPDEPMQEIDFEGLPVDVDFSKDVLMVHMQNENEAAAMNAMKLQRVRITNMDNNSKKDGDYFFAGNSLTGMKRFYIPFNVPWHVPLITLNTIKERRIQLRQGKSGQSHSLVPEFAIETLPPLTREEIEQLAKTQEVKREAQDIT